MATLHSDFNSSTESSTVAAKEIELLSFAELRADVNT